MTKRQYLTPNWPAPNNIHAFTSTRQGGVSKTPFTSFNLATHVDDDPEDVNTNIKTLISDLNLPESPTWLHQIHSNRAVCIENHDTPPDADASFTQLKNKICCVLTADCLPILLCNRDGTEIAAIHAGWRGLLADIISETIAAMHGAPQDLFAWLGPALGPNHFEVGKDVHADFLYAHPDNNQGFKHHTQRWYLDCFAMGKIQLKRAGVMAIYGGDLCTYEDKNRFYSHRRDKGATGRIASLIYIT